MKLYLAELETLIAFDKRKIESLKDEQTVHQLRLDDVKESIVKFSARLAEKEKAYKLILHITNEI